MRQSAVQVSRLERRIQLQVMGHRTLPTAQSRPEIQNSEMMNKSFFSAVWFGTLCLQTRCREKLEHIQGYLTLYARIRSCPPR